MTVKIVTDSNCDLPEAVVAQHNITVVPLYSNIGNDSYLDGVEMTREHFYEGLAGFPHHPTTSVPSPGSFVQVYSRLLDEGASELVSIHIGSALSAVGNSARLAIEKMCDDCIHVVDSGQLTLGTGLQLLAAAQAAESGASTEKIVSMLQELGPRVSWYAALDTVEFLRRSGRLSRFQYQLASVLQIKPLLKMHSGEIEMERVRTSKGVKKRLFGLVREVGELESLSLVHTGAPERAAAWAQEARGLFPKGAPLLTAEVTPVIGSHVGPGAVGLVAVASA